MNLESRQLDSKSMRRGAEDEGVRPMKQPNEANELVIRVSVWEVQVDTKDVSTPTILRMYRLSGGSTSRDY